VLGGKVAVAVHGALAGGPRAVTATSVDSQATIGCWPWQRLCCGCG
jgi:hypothetical protein